MNFRHRYSRHLSHLALFLPALFFGYANDAWLFVVLLSLFMTGALFVPASGLRLGLFPQLAIAAIGALGGYFVGQTYGGITGSEATLSPFWAALVAGTLLIAAPRLYLREPYLKHRGTFALGLLSALGCGGTLSGALYPILITGVLGLMLLTMRLNNWARPAFSKLTPRERRITLLSGLLSGIVGLVGLSVLPPAYDFMFRRIMLGLGDTAVTGFSDELTLGQLSGMLQSEKVVLRVYGENVDYLRGIAYNEYRSGKWSALSDNYLREISSGTGTSQISGRASEIRYVGEALEHRYFLPLETARVGTETGRAFVDAFGIFHALPGEEIRHVWFEQASGAAQYTDAATSQDLQVPPDVRASLEALFNEWTEDGDGPVAKLDLIESRLQREGKYSLEHETTPRTDPVVDFLLHHRQGHCEYFASAMALLARIGGIPARVVGGYRVQEHNPLGDYYIVREQNAHAWVEAYVAGSGWQRFDPTPLNALALRTNPTSFFRALFDALVSGRILAFAWASNLRPEQIVLSLSCAILAIAVPLRFFRRRKRGIGKAKPVATAALLPSFVELVDVLRGVIRPRLGSETLEDFAARVRDAGFENAEEASALLLEYAAYRYGSVGDSQELSARMKTCSLRVRGFGKGYHLSVPPPAP